MNQLYQGINFSKYSLPNEKLSAFSRQLNSIQLLRGVAALLVVTYHLSIFFTQHYGNYKQINQVFGQGYAGVDLFFVISGFVITYSTFPKNKKPPLLLNYISKRLIRIFPIYWVLLLIFWVACTLSYGNVPQADRAKVDWLTAFFLVPTHMPVIPVSWSLSYELFFYFLIGLVLYSRRLWVIFGLVIVGTLYQLVNPPLQNPVLWFVFSPYNLEFLGGVGVALLYNAKPVHKYVYWLVLLVSTVWLFVGPATNPDNQVSRFVVFGLSSIGVMFALTGLEGSQQITISNRYTKLGDASYIIYLLHPSALVFLYKYVEDRPSTPYWAFICLGIVLILVVAQVSIFIHYSLEKPMIDRLNKLVARRLA